jgi:NADH-quinone oxidoreductase subunit E
MSDKAVPQHQVETGIGLSVRSMEEIARLCQNYPSKEAALIPTLHVVQDELGWLSRAALEWVARYLQLPPVRVIGVASFYSMFRHNPPGRYRLDICTNLSCSLMGAEHLRDHLCQKLQIRPGQTTPDGLFSLNEVECLGSCGTAPVMLVNDDFHENLTPEKVDQLLMQLKKDQQAKVEVP